MSLKFARVDTQQKLEDVAKFAESFGHDPSLDLPLVTMSEGSKMFGYYHSMVQPVIFPAFHPEFTSKRNFRDAVEQVAAAHCLSSMSPQYPNGVFYCAFDTDTPAIDPALGYKMGFENLSKELYRRLP